jgi:hypothetical protein
MPWPVHPTGFFGARGDSDTYRIERSLRFNSADNAHLSRTMGTPTSQTTATLSLWVKRSGISKTNFGDTFWDAEASNYNIFAFAGTGSGNTDSLLFSFRNGGTYYSNAVYRDPSAWYHIVCVYDSTNATQADRFRFFVNGVRGTFISSPAFALNYTFEGSIGAGAYRIGDFILNSSWRPDFYLAEYYWIDGQALSPSFFGETDAITGRWKAKAYTGTFGNNGFYLKFADNSGTTATTLGKDSSSNGNNWTPNNFSVTAGAGNDSLVDSPTNYGTDTGVGGEVRGNYCTLNPIDKGSSTLANGNLDWSSSASYSCRATFQIPSTGKWYWEFQRTSANGTCVGIATQSASLASFLGSDSFGWGYVSTGNKLTNDATGTGTAYGASYTTTDIIGISFDSGAGTLVFYKNGVSQGTAYSGLTGSSYFPAVGSNTASGSFNFGQRPFAYAAPSGFKALCTQNLPQPTIQKPSKYMDALAYTGTGASNSISSLGFSPDLVWIKNRGTTTSHAIYDTIRGAQSQLSSDTTGDQVTSSSGLTSFDSNGFTIGTSTLVNTSGTQYVAWSWDESVQAGLDIVSYTGTGTNRTISHNLGVAPKMIIVKARTTAGADQGWPVWHTSIANTTYLTLNSTASTALGTDYWNSTSPTSSVFSLGTNVAVNANNDTYIAYAFSEVDGFSKFGTYTGNGSADGPFVYCGFLPKFILFKYIGAIGWIIYDTARDTSNVAARYLFANSTAAEASGSGSTDVHDILSNGFKIRTSTAGQNTNGGIYTFAAFAESPFKYARAR